MFRKPVREILMILLLGWGTASAAVPPEQADQAIQALNKTYWNAAGKYFYKLDNKTGVLDFWMSAHVWETVMDAYVRTGKAENKQQIKDMYDGFIARHSLDWTRNDYNDAISSSRVVSKGSTTYNQGTYIGSAVALGRVADAHKAADWTKANMCNTTGIFREAAQGDFGAFKLICVRYVVGLSREKGGEPYAAWMESNAAMVWATRRTGDNVMGFDWSNPAPAAGIECQSAAGGAALLNLLANPSTAVFNPSCNLG